MRHRGYAEREGEARRKKQRKEENIKTLIVWGIFGAMMLVFWVNYLGWIVKI